LTFQETFKELMTKKEEATAEREERRRRDKEATTKSFVDLQERSVVADEVIAKARLLEAEAKTKALEAEAKARLLEAEARTKLLETEATTKLLEAQAMLMAEETKIMLTDLETSSTLPGGNGWRTGRRRSERARLECPAMATAMAMARADKSASLVNLPFFWRFCRYCLILHISDELTTGWRCQDDNGICLPLICLQIICIFKFLALSICLNWSALASLLKLTKTISANMMCCVAARAGRVDQTTTRFLSESDAIGQRHTV
jgi:hypothetical protein